MIRSAVNGREIKSLDDLAEAVKHPIEGFIKIETEEDPKQIELDAKFQTSSLEEKSGGALTRRISGPKPDPFSQSSKRSMSYPDGLPCRKASA
jgi:hypothetical protein